jgi:hypothetical protein
MREGGDTESATDAATENIRPAGDKDSVKDGAKDGGGIGIMGAMRGTFTETAPPSGD